MVLSSSMVMARAVKWTLPPITPAIRLPRTAIKRPLSISEKLGVKAIDDHTLEVKLAAPASYFLAQLTHQTAFAIPRHVVEKYGKDWVKPENIVVNGPYKLVEWLPNVHTKLVKNEEFYDAANVPIDEVIYYTYEDRTAMQNRFRADELDVARDIASEQISWLRDNLSDSLRIAPYAGIYYYTVRTDKDKPDHAGADSIDQLAEEIKFLRREITRMSNNIIGPP